MSRADDVRARVAAYLAANPTAPIRAVASACECSTSVVTYVRNGGAAARSAKRAASRAQILRTVQDAIAALRVAEAALMEEAKVPR